jgi:phosphatidate cytidylyltransferase
LLLTRALTAAVLIPIAAFLVYLGGLPLLVLVASFMTLAEVEFCRLMRVDGFRPAAVFGVGLVWCFVLDAQFPALGLLQPGLTLVVLGSLVWHMFRRQGVPLLDWSLTVVGGLYVGLCSGRLIGLRGLSFSGDGPWWTFTVLAAIVAADSTAYFVGKAWGRHKFAPVLSPRKTWEGYLAGVVAGGLVTSLLTSLWPIWEGSATGQGLVHGMIVGLLVAALAPLGDLAISMIKRHVGVKDSGGIIPGHGGALDRVDSILWASVIGYYYVLWFVSGA